MAHTHVINPDGVVMEIRALDARSQRERNPDTRSFLRDLVSQLEAGQLPEGWQWGSDDDGRDSRAGTGVYGYEHG